MHVCVSNSQRLPLILSLLLDSVLLLLLGATLSLLLLWRDGLLLDGVLLRCCLLLRLGVSGSSSLLRATTLLWSLVTVCLLWRGVLPVLLATRKTTHLNHDTPSW